MRRVADVSLRVLIISRQQRLDCTRTLSPRLTQLLVYPRDVLGQVSFPFLPLSCTIACDSWQGPRVEGILLKNLGMTTEAWFFCSVDILRELDTCQNSLCYLVNECIPRQQNDGICHDPTNARQPPPTEKLSSQQQASPPQPGVGHPRLGPEQTGCAFR